MDYGARELKRDCEGPDVAELQTRLAGFRGTVPDGDFGPGTERQVMNFQHDYMRVATPTGIADRATFEAIDKFADAYPIDFARLKCPCGQCSGFGSQQFKGQYRPGMPQVEAFCLYEYPGIHRMLLWAVRAMLFYLPEHKFIASSGYRCSIHNKKKNRPSTNHHGKAIDLAILRLPGEDDRDDIEKCERARGRIVETAHAQIGWGALNRKALEPSNIAPIWVHYDVRCFEPKYLGDEAFCTTLAGLNNRKPIQI